MSSEISLSFILFTNSPEITNVDVTVKHYLHRNSSFSVVNMFLFVIKHSPTQSLRM